MRAATVIVGAIAISSCLVALALILAGGDSSDRDAVAAPQPAGRPEESAATGERVGSSSEPVPTLTQCNVEVTIEGASCELGQNVLAAYKSAGGEPTQLTALDPDSGEEVSFACSTASAPVICNGPEGVIVYIEP